MMRRRHGIVLALWCLALASAADEQSQIDFANGLFSRGFYADAAVEYRKYLTDYPQGERTQDALYRLGESESASGNHDAALKVFDQLVKPDIPEELRRRAQLRRGVVLYTMKRYADAEAALRGLSEAGADPAQRAEAQYYLGKTRFEAGRVSEALDTFKKLPEVSASSPLVPYARYQVAFIYLSQNDYENAAVEFSEIAGDASADESLRMESRFRAAEAYDKIGWFDAAVNAYRQLQQEFPGSDYARRAAYGYAWSLYHAGKLDEAYVAAAAYLRENSDAPRGAGIQYLQGNCLQQQKKYAEAIEVYSAIRTAHPDSEFAARAHYRIAWSAYMAGDLARAEAEVRDFLASGSTLGIVGDAVYLYAEILYDRDAIDQAFEQYRRVNREYPDSAFAGEALYKTGECLLLLGRPEDASRAYDLFSQKFPANPLAAEAVIRAGDADFESAAYDRAIDQYERVLGMSPNAALEELALYRLAVAHHYSEAFDKSADAFLVLLEKYPKSEHAVEARLRIGDTLLREKREPLEAMKYYKAAHEAAPSGEYAGRALRGLALARFETKDFDGAAKDFLRIVREHPDVTLNEETYAWVGQYLFDHEDWLNSAAVFEALLKNVPEYPHPGRVLYAVASALERGGKEDAAIKRYAEVVADSPRSVSAAEAKFRMAGLYAKRGETGEARRLYEEAADADTGGTAAQARFQLAELQQQAAEYDAAARNYMRLAILYFHEELSPEALWRAGQCYEKSEDTGQALKVYHELTDEYPESDQAAQAATRIEVLSE